MTIATTHALTVLAADLASLQTELRTLYVRWCVSGPTLEASCALAAMAQEEAGHARVLSRLAGEATPTVDAAEILGTTTVTDWPTFVGRAGPVELALAGITGGLRGLVDSEFQRNVAKIAVEKRHHADFFVGCFQDLEAAGGNAQTTFNAARSEAEERLAGWMSASAQTMGELGLEVNPHGLAGSVHDVPCIHCGSTDTGLLSAFGGSLMTSLLRCHQCGSQFEGVRWR